MSLDEARRELLGAWRLVSYEDREDPDGEWNNPFGPNPKGLVIYHPSGVLAVQVMADDGPPSGLAYVSYFGTFKIIEARDEAGVTAGVVEHHVEAGSMAELLEEDEERPFEVSGDRLVLGDGRTWRRVLRRI